MKVLFKKDVPDVAKAGQVKDVAELISKLGLYRGYTAGERKDLTTH